MSADTPTDTPAIDDLFPPEARTEIRRRLVELIDASLPPEAFHQTLLSSLVGLFGSRCGAIFLIDPADGLQLVAESNFLQQGFGHPSNADATRENNRLLGDLRTGVDPVRLIETGPEALSELIADPPLLGRFEIGGEPAGLIELFLPAEEPQQHREQKREFFGEVIETLTRELTKRSDPLFEPDRELPAEFWKGVETLSLRLHRSLRVHEVAATAVHETNRLLGADSVSLCLRRGRKVIFLDDSNSLEKSNSRANLVQAIRKLAKTVITQAEPLASPPGGRTLPPTQQTALAKFLEESQARRLLGIPLFKPAPLVSVDDLKKEPPPRAPEPNRKSFGCLLVEYGTTKEPEPGMRQKTEIIAAHVEEALFNAERHQKLPLRPVWSAMTEGWDWLRGRGLVKVGAILGVIALLIGLMFLIPVPYRVTADGQLYPSEQVYVFAPWEGRVERVLVEGGQRVEQDQPLVELVNDELQTEILALESRKKQLETSNKALEVQYRQARRAADKARADDLLGQIRSGTVEIEGLEEKIGRLKERSDRKIVRSPIAGVVTTFQPEQLLRNRRVSPGEILLEVMNDSGEWRLELDVEEKRMGHVLDARDRRGDELPIEFSLATDPESRFDATLTTIATRPTINRETGSVMEVHAELEESQLPRQRIGAEVRAKISTGKKSLAYWAFGDFYEFLKRRFWL